MYSNLVYGTNKNQNISEKILDPSTDKFILANNGLVIFKAIGCILSLTIAGKDENLIQFENKTKLYNNTYLYIWYITYYHIVVYLSKAYFPLVEASSGNRSNDFSSFSFDMKFFNTRPFTAVISRGFTDTIPKK